MCQIPHPIDASIRPLLDLATTDYQGRNFGLKSVGYQFRRRTRRPWAPRRWEKNGKEVSGVRESVVSSPSGSCRLQREAPSDSGFIMM